MTKQNTIQEAQATAQPTKASAYPAQPEEKSTETKAIMKKLDNIERNTLLASKQMLTIEEASLYTGFTKRYLYKLTHEKAIPFYKPSGKNVRFDKDDLTNWMRQNRTNSREEAEQQAAAYTISGGRRKKVREA